MGKTIVLAVLIAFTATPLFAAAITDSVKPVGHLKWSVSAEDNYIFKRDIKTTSSVTKFDLKKINQIYAKASLGITSYFNIYGKLGASDSGDITSIDTATVDTKIKTDYGLMYGVGLSGIREITDGWKIGVDGQFNWWEAKADKVTYGGRATTSVGGKIENFEIQGTPFITRRFELSSAEWAASPYLGVKFSYFKNQPKNKSAITFKDGATSHTFSWSSLKGDKYVGIVVGSDLEIRKNFALNIEGRFIDENALAVGGTYRF
jgi:hypothetical protein